MCIRDRPRTVQQCADALCGHEVARELDGYENRRQAVLFVGIVGCSRDFGQSRVQTLPVAQTEADILSVRVDTDVYKRQPLYRRTG